MRARRPAIVLPTAGKPMVIFPQGLSQIDARCDAGERRVLHQLKRCLEDDYLVWHNVPIGPKARQPDFVILSPRWGVLLLEVKHWKLSSMREATPDSVVLDRGGERITVANPLRQARDYAHELVDLMQHDPALVHAVGAFAGKLLFPYGHGAVFAGIRLAEIVGTDFSKVFAPHRSLLRDDLDDSLAPADFQQRLWAMFSVHYPCTLSLPQRDRVRWHLFPEVRMNAQASLDFDGEAPAALPDLLQVMDLQQEQVARTLGEGHRVIHGAAGSGKTMILVFRAQHLLATARADRPILVMCFNRTLADRIDAMLRQRGCDERVQVRTFHSWCSDMVATYQLTVPPTAGGDAHYSALAETVRLAVEHKRVPSGQYTALLIDEAHDFEDAWLRMASRMVSTDTNSLLVLYDDAQSIYQHKRRKFNFASVGIDARGRTSILRLNYRNTAEVMALAVRCAEQLLTRASAEQPSDEDDELPLVTPATAGRRGPMPLLLRGKSAQEEAALVGERIAAACADGVALDEMAVLARARYLLEPVARELQQRGLCWQSMADSAFRRFDWSAPSVKLLTMHSAKGLEFSQVFIVGLQAMPMRDETEEAALRLLYVAMTRATHRLVLGCHGDSPIVTRTRSALQAVTRQFDAPSAR
jgi:Nuclease-related domain/AAA domain/UvrD-like helicase C-terminal domain